MRRISVILVTLLVILLPTAAHAIDHWGGAPSGSAPPPGQVAAAIVSVTAQMLALAWLLIVAFPGTNFRCALFVAVGSVAAMHLFVQYIFMIFLGQWVTQNLAQEALGLALKIAILWPLVVWGASCCLGKPGRWRSTLLAAIVTAVASEVIPWLFWLAWRK